MRHGGAYEGTGGGSKGLPRWAVTLAVLVGGTALIYLLVCLFLAVYLWVTPIVF
jgi:hypothetical protein